MNEPIPLRPLPPADDTPAHPLALFAELLRLAGQGTRVVAKQADLARALNVGSPRAVYDAQQALVEVGVCGTRRAGAQGVEYRLYVGSIDEAATRLRALPDRPRSAPIGSPISPIAAPIGSTRAGDTPITTTPSTPIGTPDLPDPISPDRHPIAGMNSEGMLALLGMSHAGPELVERLEAVSEADRRHVYDVITTKYPHADNNPRLVSSILAGVEARIEGERLRALGAVSAVEAVLAEPAPIPAPPEPAVELPGEPYTAPPTPSTSAPPLPVVRVPARIPFLARGVLAAGLRALLRRIEQ